MTDIYLDISDEEYRKQLYARTARLYRDYSPGGQTDQVKRRARARKAGIASGAARRRRSTCKRRPRERTGQRALALAYRIRQVDRAEFERRYREMCDAESFPFDARGLNSAHTLYVALVRAYRAQGQDWETTNIQLARAMEIAGRGRCRRTVQRIRKRLVAMGLIGFEHVRRSGYRRIRGQLDTLRCRCLPVRRRANVTPPSGAGAAALRPTAAPAFPANSYSVPPPSAADDVGPAPPAESTKEERALFDSNATALGDGQSIDRTFRNRSEGFRWFM